MLNAEMRTMGKEKMEPKGLEFNNHFKKASFDERLSMDRKFYDKKYSIGGHPGR